MPNLLNPDFFKKYLQNYVGFVSYLMIDIN